MTRHFCYDVGRHVSYQCFSTPASATSLLLRGQARSDQYFGTPTHAKTIWLRGQARSDLCFGTLVFSTTLQYCTIPSGTFRVMSYSFLITCICTLIVI